MLKLYAFQPDGHGPSSFFVVTGSVEDAYARVMKYVKDHPDTQFTDYHYHGIELPYTKRLAPNKVSNGSYTLTISSPGEVIDNDNS